MPKEAKITREAVAPFTRTEDFEEISTLLTVAILAGFRLLVANIVRYAALLLPLRGL